VTWRTRRWRARLPWSGESIWIMNCDARCDDSRTRDEFQLEPRPPRETFDDTVQWLVEMGHLASDEARTVFYGGFDRRPSPIFQAAGHDDVARVVALVRDSGQGYPRSARGTPRMSSRS
jgi:hypothetical protein